MKHGSSGFRLELSRADIFDLLSNRRRRFVLRYLRSEREPVSLESLIRAAAAQENDKPVEAVSKEEERRMYISLYQTHIPLLDDAGLVDYDPNTKTVRPTDRLRVVEPYLDSPETGPHWHRYYLFLAMLNAALLTSGVLNVASSGIVRTVVVPFAIGSFCLLALLNLAYERWNLRLADHRPP